MEAILIKFMLSRSVIRAALESCQQNLQITRFKYKLHQEC